MERIWVIPVLASILILGTFPLNDAFAVDPPPFEIMLGFGVDDGSAVFQTCTSGCQAGIAGGGSGQFNFPLQVSVDSFDNVYVVDQNNFRVQKFDSNGGFLTSWGSFGGGPGQFILPYGIDVNSVTGDVYVSDSGSNRIQKFDSNGGFLLQWSSGFNTPRGVSVDSVTGDVYVVDHNNNRIQKFDSSGNSLTSWGSFGTAEGQFKFPFGIVVDSAHNVYVSGFINDRIQKFDSSGTFLEMWGYGVDDGTNAFQICTSGCQDGISGSGDGQFFSSLGIEVDSDDNVYVGGGNPFRIQKFDSSGTFLTKWGSSGTGEGQFNAPVDIAIDSAGNVYVSDQFNNRIQKFSGSPQTPSELIDSIEDLGLPSNVENNLKAPLKNAQDKLDDDNPKNDGAACGKMDAFINMVNAQEGKKLTTDQAEELREAAQSVKDSMGC